MCHGDTVLWKKAKATDVLNTNAAILPDLIDSARARGYTFSLLP